MTAYTAGRSVVALAAACLVSCGGGSSGLPTNPVAPAGVVPGEPAPTGASRAVPPANLRLPVDPNAINLRGVINPFGIVRSSLDEGRVGHPGIDLPQNTGAPIFAVAGGQVVSVTPATDGLPGFALKLLIAAGADSGTGWVFLYGHVVPLAPLGVGSAVTAGQRIATNAQDPAFTNHLELAWAFNGFQFHSNQTCWVPQLESGARSRFTAAFNTMWRTSQRFIDAWTTVSFEGRLPFRELLARAKFPGGARPCYPPGTDVRVNP